MSKLTEKIKQHRERDKNFRKNEEKTFKSLDVLKRTPLKSNSTIALESLVNDAPTDYLLMGKLLDSMRNDLIELEFQEREDGLHPYRLTDDQVRKCLMITSYLVDGKMENKTLTLYLAGLRHSSVLLTAGTLKRIFQINYTQVHRIVNFLKKFELTEVVDVAGGKYILSFNKLLREVEFIFRDVDINY